MIPSLILLALRLVPTSASQRPLGSLPRKFGAAVASPTAILHAFTGVTLVVGYLHTRTLDQVVMNGQ